MTAGTLTSPVTTEGQPFSGTIFHFTDTNPNSTASDYTSVVVLGDGNSVTLNSSGVVSGSAGASGRIVADGSGFDVQLSYTYAKILSNQTFGVTVTDAGGVSTSASTSTFSVAETPSLVVTTVSDVVNPYDGLTSLREAVAYANSLPGGGTITFAPGLAGQTIVLTSDKLELTNTTGDITIQGPGRTNLRSTATTPSPCSLLKEA